MSNCASVYIGKVCGLTEYVCANVSSAYVCVSDGNIVVWIIYGDVGVVSKLCVWAC